MDIDDHNFKLSPGERASPVWQRVSKHVEFLLETARKRNDNHQDEVKTASLRGEIKSLRSILAFGTDPPPILDDGGEPETPRRRR